MWDEVIKLPPDHDSRERTKRWLVRLGGMKAHEELGYEPPLGHSEDRDFG